MVLLHDTPSHTLSYTLSLQIILLGLCPLPQTSYLWFKMEKRTNRSYFNFNDVRFKTKVCDMYTFTSIEYRRFTVSTSLMLVLTV